MEGVGLQDLVTSLGVAGPFVWYLIQREAKERESRDLQSRAQLRLALAIERLVMRFTGQPFNVSQEESDEARP